MSAYLIDIVELHVDQCMARWYKQSQWIVERLKTEKMISFAAVCKAQQRNSKQPSLLGNNSQVSTVQCSRVV
jgi:hypothetical protein